MLTLTDRGLILWVSDTTDLTITHYFQQKQCAIVGAEIAGHGGLVATVSGFLIVTFLYQYLPKRALLYIP